MMKKLLIVTLVAGSFGSITLPASADVIVARQAPPALRAETVPAPRRNQTWIPGHWEWRNNHHVWVRGTWIRDRRGYVYNQPTWTERDGRWEMTRGAWRRGDRDGDGVPNRMDERPNNPNRY
jgi:hypothetical protein